LLYNYSICHDELVIHHHQQSVEITFISFRFLEESKSLNKVHALIVFLFEKFLKVQVETGFVYV